MSTSGMGVISLPVIEWCLDRIDKFSEEVIKKTTTSDAVVGYHLMGKGLAWSDEHVASFPDRLSQSEFDKFYITLVYGRTLIILGHDLGEEGKRLFTEVTMKCEGWSFCHDSRFSPELSTLFVELKKRAQSEFRQHLGD